MTESKTIEIPTDNIRNRLIIATAMDLVKLSSKIRSVVYANGTGNKQRLLKEFRSLFFLLVGYSVIDDIGTELKTKITEYNKLKLKPTDKNLMYSVELFESVYVQLVKLEIIPK